MPESLSYAVLKNLTIFFLWSSMISIIENWFLIKSKEKDIKRGRYYTLSWLQKAFIEG